MTHMQRHDAMVREKTIDEFIKLLKNECYHEDCYGDKYPSSSMVVEWQDILKVAEQLKGAEE